MTCAESVLRFCEKAEEGRDAEQILYIISGLSSFRRYELQCSKGRMRVRQEDFYRREGAVKGDSENVYFADWWDLTEEGYLMLSSSRFSEETCVLSLSDTKEHIAARVFPLAGTCRELARKYLRPAGCRRSLPDSGGGI